MKPETGRIAKFWFELLLIIAGSSVIFMLAIRFHYFEKFVNRISSALQYKYGDLDEYLTVFLLPSLVLAVLAWRKIIELRREIEKRKQMEEALRSSERRMNLAQQIAHTGDWEWEIATNRVYWSEELFRIYGYEPHEIVPDCTIVLDGMSYAKDEFLDAIDNVFKVDKAFETDCSFLRKDGSVAILRTMVRVSRTDDGKPGLLTGTVQDITEQQQMTWLLAEKENRLRTLVQTIPDLIWLKDTDGVYLYCNTMFERFFGAREADIVGRTDYDFVSREQADFFREHDRKAMAAGRPSSNEEWVTFADDGRYALLETIKTPMLDATGSLVGVLGIARDITERKQAEEALRESEERFRLAFEQSAEGIVFADHGSGDIVYANATMGKLLGYSPEELVNGGMALIYRHLDKEMVKAFPDILLQNDYICTRIRATRNDGAVLVVSLRIRLVKIGGKDLEYLSLRDMTDKVRLENEARASHARLIHANKLSSLGMLVSGMAHEINNPNNFIMFNTSMLSDIWNDANHILEDYYRQYGEFSLGGLPFAEVGGATRKLIDGIAEGSQRIKTIVDDLKDFARQDKSSPDGLIHINQAVLKAVSILTPQIKKYTTNFRLDLDEQIPDALGNAQQIEQVIMNLLLNALQALPEKGCAVNVATSVADSGALTITIKDQGIGMDGETLEKIAEPFFTTKIESAGTGLGLFISKTIITGHNGKLCFDSAPGKGTSVVIELPQYMSRGVSDAEPE